MEVDGEHVRGVEELLERGEDHPVLSHELFGKFTRPERLAGAYSPLVTRPVVSS